MDERGGTEFVQHMLKFLVELQGEANEEKWPADLSSQGKLVSRLALTVRDQRKPWWCRQRAYDYLVDKARELTEAVESGQMQPGNIPRELPDWFMLAAAHQIGRPKRPRGNDQSVDVLRNWVFSYTSGILVRTYNFSRDQAAAMIGDAYGMSIEGVISAIQRGNKVAKLVVDDIPDHELTIWHARTR